MAKISRLGQYRLVREIGKGGMGTVYEAVQESLDRRVALKVLPPQLMKNVEFVERFKREAKSAARLHQHPNIVTVFDTGQDQGFYFYSMELVDGSSLQALIKEKGRLGIEETIGLMRQAIAGLAYAWEQNIIHRDIKPDNLMLTNRGVLKIADFGLAKARMETESLGLTGTGSSMGTPYYMSPEQGVNAKDVDHRADVYSLGETFYHLLTGKVPFEGSSPIEVAIKVATASFVPVRDIRSEVFPELAQVVERMLHRYPASRYQTADELMVALEAGDAKKQQQVAYQNWERDQKRREQEEVEQKLKLKQQAEAKQAELDRSRSEQTASRKKGEDQLRRQPVTLPTESKTPFICSNCKKDLQAAVNAGDTTVVCPMCLCMQHIAVQVGSQKVTPPAGSIRFRCPKCKTDLQADVDAAHTVVTCPECKQNINALAVTTMYDRIFLCALLSIGCNWRFYKQIAAFRKNQEHFSGINGLKRS